MSRNWERYAKVLDMHLEGYSYREIARQFGVTRQFPINNDAVLWTNALLGEP
jgi:transposase